MLTVICRHRKLRKPHKESLNHAGLRAIPAPQKIILLRSRSHYPCGLG
jgi:hypothetical protein